MDPDHHRGIRGTLRGPHIECQAVFAGRLGRSAVPQNVSQPGRRELGAGRAILGRLTRLGPAGRRLRRPPAQPTNGRGGIRHALERSDIHTDCADQNAGIYRDAIELDAAGGPD